MGGRVEGGGTVSERERATVEEMEQEREKEGGGGRGKGVGERGNHARRSTHMYTQQAHISNMCYNMRYINMRSVNMCSISMHTRTASSIDMSNNDVGQE